MVHKKVKSQKRRQSKTQKRSHQRSRSQKGGAWYNPFSWFGTQTYVPEEEKSMVNRIGESITSGIQKVDDTLATASTSISQGATNIVNSTTDLLNKDVSLMGSSNQEQPLTTYQSNVVGGKRRKSVKHRNKSRTRHLARKGGKGLGLTYYASPVSDIKIAEPTYLLNYEGGRRYRHKSPKVRKTSKK